MLDALLRADGAVPAPAGFKPIPVKLEFPGQRFHQLRLLQRSLISVTHLPAPLQLLHPAKMLSRFPQLEKLLMKVNLTQTTAVVLPT